jgi:DNA-binding MltR family transcriptional regulator
VSKRIQKPVKLTEDSQAFYQAINDEAPLPCALISVAFLEKAVTAILAGFFVQCDTAKTVLGENGFLGEFSRCADVAYCLGLVSNGALKNLKRVGKIRNLFAHSHQLIDFNDHEVREHCAQLTFPKISQAIAVGGEKPTFLDDFGKNPRSRFTLVSVLLFQTLMLQAHSVEQRNRHRDQWHVES